jgi:Ca-activated chloride channel family protein
MVEIAGIEARDGATVLKVSQIQMLCFVAVWILLLAAIAKPQRVGEPVVKTESSRDIMLAIDLSGSMDYVDFPDGQGNMVSRFDAVQRVVDQFVGQRESDRIGLIVFGTRAFLQLPFTRDLDTARKLVELMNVGMAGPQTALGDAIGLSIKSFESSEVDQKLLILLTDGTDTASKMTPVNAAEIAKLNGVEIFTIGVGDPEATDEDRVDFAVLQTVADRTNGQFFTAEDEFGLEQVYSRIDEIAPGETRTQSWRPRQSLVHWPLGLALGIILILFLGQAVSLIRGGVSRQISESGKVAQ